jgi:bacterioferritin-associated ferredoxin
MYVCVCNAITEREIRQCADLGASSLADLRECLGVASCCGCCADSATEVLNEHAGAMSACLQAA